MRKKDKGCGGSPSGCTADEKERAGGAGRPFKASRIVEQGRPENLELEDAPSTTSRTAGFQDKFTMPNFSEDHFSRLLFWVCLRASRHTPVKLQ